MSARPVLLSCDSIAKQFGARPLFTGLSFGLFEGDRVGLVGPNGAGKSTLLKILAGIEETDSGTRSVRKGLRVGYVPQDPTFTTDHSAEEVLIDALAGLPLEEYEKSVMASIALGKLGFADPEQTAGTLSGGWQKRLAIARELVREPDVLLLDEPTNHLDLEGILELEGLLASEPRAFVVASHDRYFLENVAQRMIELDRVYPEGLLQVDGTYSDLLEKRDEVRKNQAEYQESLANRARREMEWLRRGPKARTTKSKSRIQEANRLIGELGEIEQRTVEATASIDFAASGRKTKRLLMATGIGKSYGDRTVLEGIDLLIRPGTRLGLLGPNGSGKTTLLSLLAGLIEPDTGEIERAPFLKVVLFEQSRETLDRTLTLRRALAPEGDSVVHQGREIHVAAWAKRFLFRTEQLETPVSRLSGGEQARILIARLMLRPADLLILDEPTNDLDIPTLEVLEESLLEFPGGLVLVTHDRYLLDRVSTEILALDGRGGARTFADVAQWQEQRDQGSGGPGEPSKSNRATQAPAAPPPKAAPAIPAKAGGKRLTFAEQKEWERIEADILAADEKLRRSEEAVADPKVASNAAELAARCTALDAARGETERLYARWAELEAKRNG
ncbi:MAG TPA: ABC-F family ATP-binding cassette domain-containing protein [Thermoanaerobaculia bacterium]|jgi:ATP-binding cassette subfamily F protein uup|nr:ABC-F family ATP-binding cassette domain-containing protein [Thermoanaerobaculia bacterium]